MARGLPRGGWRRRIPASIVAQALLIEPEAIPRRLMAGLMGSAISMLQ
jgi:hypothetical protein